MPYELTREALESETRGVLAAITHPKFIERMQRFRAKSGDDRIDYAEENLIPRVLIDQGVPLPDNMRVSSRVFEEVLPIPPEYADYPEGERIIELVRNYQPKLLKQLRETNPIIWEDLQSVINLPNEHTTLTDTSPNPSGACGCACGGAATVCGGAGGGFA